MIVSIILKIFLNTTSDIFVNKFLPNIVPKITAKQRYNRIFQWGNMFIPIKPNNGIFIICVIDWHVAFVATSSSFITSFLMKKGAMKGPIAPKNIPINPDINPAALIMLMMSEAFWRESMSVSWNYHLKCWKNWKNWKEKDRSNIQPLTFRRLAVLNEVLRVYQSA